MGGKQTVVDLSSKDACPVVLSPVQLGSSLQNFRLEPYLGSAKVAKDKNSTSSSSNECLSDFEGYFYLVFHHEVQVSSSSAESRFAHEIDRLNQQGLVLDLDLPSEGNEFKIESNERMVRDAEKLENAIGGDKKLSFSSSSSSSSSLELSNIIDETFPPIPLCLRPKSDLRRKTQLWSFVSRVPLTDLEKK